MSLDFLEDLPSDYENALLQTGYGRFHLLLLILCGLIYLNTAIGVTIISFVLPSATCDFQMSSEDKGWLSAAVMLGMLLGSYFWGCLADTKGRRTVLIASLLFDGLCGIISSVIPSYIIFLGIRFLNGFNTAGAMGIVFPYLGEFQPTKHREKILCWMELFWTFGIILLPGIAWLIIPLRFKFENGILAYKSWNLFVGICAIPSILLGCWLLVFPESPKFLLEHGETDKALEILVTIFVKNTGRNREEYPCKQLLGSNKTTTSITPIMKLSLRKPDELKLLIKEIWRQTMTLFNRTHGKNTILTCGIQFCLTASYYTLMVWFPELFQRFDAFELQNPGQLASVCDVTSIVIINTNSSSTCDQNINSKVYFHTVIIGLSCIPTSFLLPLCVHRLGIKFFLVFSLIAAGIVTIGLYFVRTSMENLILSCIFEALTSLSISTVYCVMVDLFPTNLRHKSKWELVRISAAVMGIEFSYAAETAFVSPTLLQIGVEHKHMTLVWALSPLVGFFLCPILGSISDRCKLNMGRRRPFIIILSIGVVLGLLLVPHGEDLGYVFGDVNPYVQMAAMNTSSNITFNNFDVLPHRTTSSASTVVPVQKTSHPWGIFFTVLGTVLLDFDADACQSPSRAYLLDVCIPDDHARGLSTFTVMAGLGGFMGYSMGGINWDKTAIGRRLGGHVKAVFTIITFIFIGCVSFTISSFKEIPLWAIASDKKGNNISITDAGYGAIDIRSDSHIMAETNLSRQCSTTPEETTEKNSLYEKEVEETIFIDKANLSFQDDPEKCGNQKISENEVESLSHYLLSIIYMPFSIRMICLTNLFCWMAHVCYSLYFTDFVGEAVFNGDPKALEGSPSQIRYEEGVRFGCWGMAMYSLSCSCYSLVIDKLIKRFKAKAVYVGGLLFYCVGMTLMAMTKAKATVIIFSWAAGVMYSTLFTMPYLLIAHYHSSGIFEVDTDGSTKTGTAVRGLGTDIAIISSMVFLAQFILSLCMGTIVSLSGTTTAVVSTASFLSFCGALSATQIMYLDL